MKMLIERRNKIKKWSKIVALLSAIVSLLILTAHLIFDIDNHSFFESPPPDKNYHDENPYPGQR